MPDPASEDGTPKQHLPVWRRFAKRQAPRIAADKVRLGELARKTLRAMIADRVFGHAAELGFYFLFSLFPTLFCAGSVMGLMARSAHQISDRLLEYLALVIPTSAFETVLDTFNQTASAASSGKVTFGSIAAIWSASVGISAIQDTLNEVFELEDRRSYVMARLQAILLTILLTAVIGSGLACMFAGDFAAALIDHTWSDATLAAIAGFSVRFVAWILSGSILALSFAVLYHWAPDWGRPRRWRWISPGTFIGIAVWLMASLALRVYLHFFNTYSVTYGSLGAVIILLTWFYISGLMLLLGAEIDKAVDEARAKGRDTGGTSPPIAISSFRRAG
jgi:membrane protein